MKKILFLLVAVILFQSCDNLGFDKRYTIVVDENADTLTIRGVRQLQHYWEEVTGKNLMASVKKIPGRTPIYIGNIKRFPRLEKYLKPANEKAFLISVNDTGIILSGKKGIANIYAINTFIEEKLGCIKFTSTEEYCPKNNKVRFKNFFKVYNPSFSLRVLYFADRNNRDFREWYKLDDLSIWGMYVHTFNKLIPPSKYYKAHPEYYSLVKGRRLQDAQLCLSNPEVVNLLIKNLGDTIKKNPSKKYWSVSQNDTYNPCECDNCKKLYKKYGSYSGAYVQVANKVAEAYPDKIISTLAYQFTRKAPENIKPDSNTNIMLCTIECSRNKPLEENKNIGSFAGDLKKWSTLTHNIYLWDYVVQFKNLLTPFPNFPVLKPNLQFFKAHNVDMVFEQGSGGSWSDLMELKQYLLAKLLWDVNANTDSLAAHFINAYYGDAAKYVLNYYHTMNRNMVKNANSETLGIYGFPSDYTDSFLKPELMEQYLAYMDSAEKAVAYDSVYLRRVKRVRLPVDFSWVDIAVNNDFKTMPALISTENGKEINPLIIRLLNSMEAYEKTDNRISINERKLSIKDYKKFVINLLQRKIKPNKLKDADVKVISQYSNTYPVGGAKALTDNLLGPMDFHHNWLGFHGTDMVVVADFKKPVEISEVEMNFLKAVNSWVFLPVDIKIEISDDGKNYRLLKAQKGDNSDRSYLVKSVPFKFNFKPVKTRFLRVTALSMKTCPDWHRGFGNPSWIFTDEIIVN